MAFSLNFRIYIYSFLVILFPVCGYAQVGVNTISPLGVFHIDAQGNTSGGTNFLDDIIIDSNGNVGLGTLTPQASFDITGKLRFSDNSGTNFTDYILASDENGKASWKNYLIALRYKTIEWRLDNAAWGEIDASSNVFTLSGTPTLKTELGASTTGTSLTVPKGRYLIFMAGNIENVSEYAEVRLLKNGSPIMSPTYIRALSACATYVEFTAAETLSIQFAVFNINRDKNTAIPFLDTLPFAKPNHVWAELVLLGLDVGG